MENENQYENEMAVPSREKLEAMVNLFDHAMTEEEQRLFLLYMLTQSLEMFGPENVKAKLEVMIADGVGDCPDNCPLCNPEKGHMSEAEMIALWEEISSRGIPAREDDEEGDDWDEVIH